MTSSELAALRVALVHDWVNGYRGGEKVLRECAELFPNSANAWDSLAEITLYLGDTERAIELYRKALDVDPGFANATEQLEALRDDGEQ